MEIIPHFGLSLIPFGVTKSQVLAQLGFPTKSHVTDFGDCEIQYFQHKLVLKFEKENGDRLGWIEVHNKDFKTFGVNPWALPKENVIELFTKQLGESPELEDYFSFESYLFDKSWVELQFEFGELSSINLGVLYDDKDQPIWPDKT
jgi:hypothetical protein